MEAPVIVAHRDEVDFELGRQLERADGAAKAAILVSGTPGYWSASPFLGRATGSSRTIIPSHSSSTVRASPPSVITRPATSSVKPSLVAPASGDRMRAALTPSGSSAGTDTVRTSRAGMDLAGPPGTPGRGGGHLA